VANAEHNHNLAAGNLYVKEITVGQAMPLKRMRPRAFGRGYLIKKHGCHINLVLTDNKQ
jgi:large subunit ribosomal protein L22